MHKLWLKVFALFLTTAVFFASGCLDKDSKTDTGADVALPEAPEDIDGAENIKDASGRFLSLPFNDSEVEIVQGYFYTWDKVDNPTHMGIDYIKKDKNNSWLHFEVLAAADGVAMQNEHEGIGLGKYVVIRHDETVNGMHYYSLYAHLVSVELSIPNRANWDANYDQWERVSKGNSIGIAGDTGYPGDIHLHFEVFTGNTGSYQERTNNRVDPYDIKGYAKDYPKPPDVMSGSGESHLWIGGSMQEDVLGTKTQSEEALNYNEELLLGQKGNTAGNIANGGIAAIQGDWIYYVNDSDGYSIYKIHTDGNGRTKINNDNSKYLNVIGDWIYYCKIVDDKDAIGSTNFDHNYNIYKIRTDGSKRTQLNHKNSVNMIVVDGWIYYTQLEFDDENVTGNLYKIRTDGSEPTKLSDDIALFLNVVDDWIYYTNESDGHRIYKIRTDGSERAQLTFDDDAHFNINVVGEWIYSSSMLRAQNLIRTELDGSDQGSYTNIRYSQRLNYSDGWLFYLDWHDNNAIYKVRIDNTEKTKLNDGHTKLINIVGEWVYYGIVENTCGTADSGIGMIYVDGPVINVNNNEDIFRIKSDGSNREKVY